MEIAQTRRTLEEEKNKIEKEKEKQQEIIEYYNKCISNFDNIIKEKCSYYPQLAVIMADLLTLYYERSAKFLSTKKRPAPSEAFRIRELRKETKKIMAEKKFFEYRYNYIIKLYPNIEDIFEPGYNEELFDLETDEDTDRIRYYLTNDEYNSLSIAERNQLALDRYIDRRKSKWQIGRDYELYIGYQCENQGFQVKYNGTLKKLEDMGIDLISSRMYLPQRRLRFPGRSLWIYYEIHRGKRTFRCRSSARTVYRRDLEQRKPRRLADGNSGSRILKNSVFVPQP